MGSQYVDFLIIVLGSLFYSFFVNERVKVGVGRGGWSFFNHFLFVFSNFKNL